MLKFDHASSCCFTTLFNWLVFLALPNYVYCWTVKITGKLQDGTVFTKKGCDEEPFEFKTDEG
jgi:hypothetical protein